MTLRPIAPLVFVVAAIGALLIALWSSRAEREPVTALAGAAMSPPFLVYRTLAPGVGFGRVAVVELRTAAGAPLITDLTCSRVHYAAGQGLCAVAEPQDAVNTWVAYAFNATFQRGARIPLAGLPTRVRVAPDGTRAAVTTYREEETADGERLAVDTLIVELPSGRVLADLREFSVATPDGAPVNGPLDISSVSFDAASDRFFAAVSSPSERYLTAGTLGDRRLQVLRTGVLPEAVSPDGRQLLVKRPGAHGFWQLALLDLATLKERDLPHGTRSIDDQVEWLDAERVLFHDVYGDGTALWSLATDGATGPRLLMPDGYSGSVQR